jgi:hypothetical protein
MPLAPQPRRERQTRARFAPSAREAFSHRFHAMFKVIPAMRRGSATGIARCRRDEIPPAFVEGVQR